MTNGTGNNLIKTSKSYILPAGCSMSSAASVFMPVFVCAVTCPGRWVQQTPFSMQQPPPSTTHSTTSMKAFMSRPLRRSDCPTQPGAKLLLIHYRQAPSTAAGLRRSCGHSLLIQGTPPIAARSVELVSYSNHHRQQVLKARSAMAWRENSVQHWQRCFDLFAGHSMAFKQDLLALAMLRFQQRMLRQALLFVSSCAGGCRQLCAEEQAGGDAQHSAGQAGTQG